ncbi:hypothetical protein P0Y35_07640 [Kiritimatiellaeota bacterium B1221]|nr:hypothetical protein [Kiritimatiellaeota bacterium B1221]
MNPHLRFQAVAEAPSIHTYFDVVPESPDGKKVVYFRFDGKPLDHGTICIREREGDRVTEVMSCPGSAHGAAQQGWLDSEHIYFTANDQVQIASLSGEIVQSFPGAIDTIHPQTRRGLAPSKNWRGAARPPKEKACFRIDIDDGSLQEVLDVDRAWEACRGHLDLEKIDKSLMNFKHSKWSPDGSQWFVVFTNEEQRKAHPGLEVVKVLIAADDQGQDVRFIGSFHHHPNWTPDGKKIMGFAGQPGEVHLWDPLGGAAEVLCRFPGEGHPAMHPRGGILLTDDYVNDETMVYAYHLSSDTIRELVRYTDPKFDWQIAHPPRQLCHAHPVWSHEGQRIYMNRVVDNLPQLVVMDARALLKS